MMWWWLRVGICVGECATQGRDTYRDRSPRHNCSVVHAASDSVFDFTFIVRLKAIHVVPELLRCDVQPAHLITAK